MKPKKIKDPKDLPTWYMVVDENWEKTIEKKDDKLRKRDMMVKRPFKLYLLTRKSMPNYPELCIELEKI